jgi:hypothetical protein
VGKPVIDQIIENAHRRNPENGTTGLLVFFGSGIFFSGLKDP